MKIFVSYTMRDGYFSFDRLSELYRIACRFGITFIDALESDIPKRQNRVEKALIQADIVLILVTKAFEQSPWAKKERSMAEKYQKKTFEFNILETTSWIDVLQSIEQVLTKVLYYNPKF